VISKITKLHGIGTLHAPLLNGALTLKSKTIIYGENGRGKSTLVAVLRSLASGDTTGLRQRKTIKGTHAQSAQFLLGTQPHDLSNDKWSKIHPEITVFDSTFITENVYSGASVDPDQRKNLLSFAIGSQGVSLAKSVDELAVKIAEKRVEETAAKDEIRGFIKGELTPEDFAKLAPEDAGAEANLEVARKNRDAVARASTILDLQTASPISFEGFNRARLSELLSETIESISADAAERIRAHIESAHVTEGWLEQGSQFQTEGSCPYCAQNTVGVPLVQAYKLGFSDAYKAFKTRLKSEMGALVDVISPENWVSVGAVVQGNRTKLIPWREFLTVPDLPFDLRTYTRNIEDARTVVREVISRKLASPIDAVMLTEDEVASLDALEKIVVAVDDYNAAQVLFNAEVARLRDSVSGGNLQDAERNVRSIENRISRATGAAETSSRKLLDAIAARLQLEKDKDAARSGLDDHMKTVVGQYKDSINKHLEGCGTAFRIEGLKTVYTGAKPRFDYVIELFGAPVDLANKPSSAIIFDSALSLGDKGALAFAFFLAKLENDPRRAQYTVVFDDPLSSLDGCRRRYTRQQIAALSSEVAQVIVLTHEESTVADIASRMYEPDCAIFELKAQGDLSVFVVTNVKEITASDYARCFDAMTHYLHGLGKPEDVVKKVRPFLELNLRYRFPEMFSSDQSLGKMIGQIRSCDTSNPLGKMNAHLRTLEELNEYATKHSHGDGALVVAEKMLESDLRSVVTRALDFARGLPN